MYGLREVYKDIINNCPLFRPILSTINTPSHKLAKFIVPTLKSLISNEYAVKDSLKRLLTPALMHFLKILKEQKVY